MASSVIKMLMISNGSYVGRKIVFGTEESFVDGSSILKWPGLSHWSLGYMLSSRGARKLINQKPLQKMIPIDEFLPIMFDQHIMYVCLFYI